MDTIYVYGSKDGPRWRRVAPNGREVAPSGEAFSSEDAAIEAAERQGDGKCRIVVDRGPDQEPETIFEPDEPTPEAA